MCRCVDRSVLNLRVLVQRELALSLILNLESMPELQTVYLGILEEESDLPESEITGFWKTFWKTALSNLKTLSRLEGMKITICAGDHDIVLTRYISFIVPFVVLSKHFPSSMGLSTLMHYSSTYNLILISLVHVSNLS